MSTSLLLRYNGTDGSTSFFDVMGRAITAAGGAQISTAQSKFGGASGKITAVSDWLSTPGGDHLNVTDAQSFLLELFLWRNSNASWGQICDFGGEHISMMVDNAGRLVVVRRGVTIYQGPATADIENRCSVTVNQWHHIAIEQDAAAGSFLILFDGHCALKTNTVPLTSSATVYLAGSQSPVGALNGYVDEQRVLKNEAPYTYAGTAPAYDVYAVPTAEFPIPPVVGAATGFQETAFGTPYGKYRQFFTAGAILKQIDFGTPGSSHAFVARRIVARNQGPTAAQFGTPNARLPGVPVPFDATARIGMPRAITNRHTGRHMGFSNTGLGTPLAWI